MGVREGAAAASARDFDPIAFLNNEGWQRVELGLDRTRELLARLGDPQKACAYVHVAGTNGKGSVCAFIERTLRAAGYAPGLFTSPAIYSFEERICVDGQPIDAESLYAATQSVKRAVDAMTAEGWEHPTGFELMFAVAAVHFKAVGCRIAVLEVGLGGRLDATNIIERPEVCVITPIGLDHTDVLGDTVAAIAAEKAAIVKPGATVVTGFQEPAALAVIEAAAAQAACPLVTVDVAALASNELDIEAGRRRFTYQGESYETALLGSYQPANAALAIEACRALAGRGWNIDADDVRTGIAEATWPGRFEIVGTEPLVIVDGAHNPQGAASLRRSLDDLLAAFSARAERPPIACALGVLADKDAAGILSEVVPIATSVTTFAPPSGRALAAEELARLARDVAATEREKNPEAFSASGLEITAASSAAEALASARASAGAGGIVVCAGSLYSLGALREALREQTADGR